MTESGRLLAVNDLHTYFYTFDGVARAVNGVTCHIDKRAR